MTPHGITTIEQALEFARGYVAVYGGDEKDIQRMAELVLSDAKAGEGGASVKSCRCTGRISQKSLWLEHTKAADYGPQVDDELLNGWLKSVDKVMRDQVREVLKAIRGEGEPTAETVKRVIAVLKDAKWDQQLIAGMRPYLANAMRGGASIGIENLATLVKSPAVFQMGWSSQQLDEYIENASTTLATKISTGVNGTMRVRVEELLGDGIQKGEDIRQLARRVEDWARGESGDDEDEVESMTRRRARTIARTESARAYGTAARAAWRATGLVKGKRWLLAPDPCPFCEAAAAAYGEEGVGLDEPFYKKGESLEGVAGEDGETTEMVLDYEDVDGPPLHPNCRCSTIPVLVDAYEDLAQEVERRLAGEEPRAIRA